MTIQKVVNRMLENGYSVAVAQKIKFIFNQFCEYAIDSKWILVNPTHKIKIRTRDKLITKSEIHTRQFHQKSEIDF